MSVQQVTMFRIICDGADCGACAQEIGDFYAWADVGQAEDDAIAGEWIITDDHEHYCGECTTWDDERDERVPKVASSNELSYTEAARVLEKLT